MEMAWVGHGTLAYTCLAQNCDFPVGTVWVRLTSMGGKAVCEILDIYVPVKQRRMGIGTFMMKFLLRDYGILRTGGGTKEGGMALMKSLGWKECPEAGCWYLRGKPKFLTGRP
jgi:hypothetical protein